MDDPQKGIGVFRLPQVDTPYRVPDFDLSSLELIDKSASGLLENLDKLVAAWRKELPLDAQPVILAILANGVVIEAREFSDAGHNGIGLRGRLADGSECLVLAHQANLQLLCRVVKEENPQKRYPIGFRYAGKLPGQ